MTKITVGELLDRIAEVAMVHEPECDCLSCRAFRGEGKALEDLMNLVRWQPAKPKPEPSTLQDWDRIIRRNAAE